MKIEFVKEAFEKMNTFLKESQANNPSETIKKTQAVVENIFKQIKNEPIDLSNYGTELLKEVRVYLKENKEAWSNEDVRAFMLALSSIGISGEKELLNIFFEMSKEEVFDDQLTYFLHSFPTIINYEDENGNNALHLSLISNAPNAYKILVNNGVSQNHLNKSNQNIYDLMLQTKTPEYLFLAAIDKNAITKKDKFGNSYLHQAIQNNDLAFVQFYLDYLDVNERNFENNTPLDLALALENSASKTAIINILLINNAKIDQKNIEVAISSASPEEIKTILIQAKSSKILLKKEELLALAIKREENAKLTFESVLSFFDKKKSPDAMAISMLENAVKNKEWAFALSFIKAGYSPKKIDHFTKTLIKFLPDTREVLTLLLKQNPAFLNQKRKDETLLFHAISTQNIDLAQCCIDAGADPRIKCHEFQQTVFEIAFNYPQNKKIINSLDWSQFRVDDLSYQKLTIKLLDPNFCKKNQTYGALVNYLVNRKYWPAVQKLLQCEEKKQFHLYPISKEAVQSAILEKQWEILKDIIRFNHPHLEDPLLDPFSVLDNLIQEKQWSLVELIIKDYDCVENLRNFDSRNSQPICFNNQELRSALSTAGKEKEWGVVFFILKQLKESSLKTIFFDKPVFEHLIESKRWDLVGEVINEIKDLNELGENKDLVFQEGLKNKNLNIMTKMLELGYPGRDVQVDKTPLLHFLCQQKEVRQVLKCIEKINERGVDLNEKDSDGHTALYYAFRQKESLSLAFKLIILKAEFSITDYDFSISQTTAKKFLTEIKNFISSRNPNLSIESLQNIAQLNEFLGNLEPELREKVSSETLYLAEELQEQATNILKTASINQRSQTEEIPEIQYIGNLYGDLENAFKMIEDRDLEGISNIEDKNILPNQHRANFNDFLRKIKSKKDLTGASSKIYRHIENALKHIAIEIKNKKLPIEERISILTAFSRIGKGYCSDPFVKAATWAYNTLKGEESAVSSGDPISKLKQEIIKNFVESRETVLMKIFTRMDTHAVNLILKYFGPEIGLKYDGDDPFLEKEGALKLALGLHNNDLLNKLNNLLELYENANLNYQDTKQRLDNLLKEYQNQLINIIKEKFWNQYRGFSFQRFGQALQAEMKENFQGVLDYFHYLIDAKKGQDFAQRLSLSENKESLNKYNLLLKKIPESKTKIDELNHEISITGKEAERGIQESKNEQIKKISELKEEVSTIEKSLLSDQENVQKLADELGEEATNYKLFLEEINQEHEKVSECMDYDLDTGKTFLTHEGLLKLFHYVLQFEKL